MIGHLVERAKQARGPEAHAAKLVRDAKRLQRRYARESWHVFLRRQRERVERMVAAPKTSPRVLEETAMTPFSECELLTHPREVSRPPWVKGDLLTDARRRARKDQNTGP